MRFGTIQRSRFHQVDHHRGRHDLDGAGAHTRGGVAGADDDFCGALKARFQLVHELLAPICCCWLHGKLIRGLEQCLFRYVAGA
jgi:hypothetical protein